MNTLCQPRRLPFKTKYKFENDLGRNKLSFSLICFQMPILDKAAAGDNIFGKKAVFIILGILVERCPDQIRSSGVDRILIFIKEGLNSDYPLLLNGALFTFARFVEHLKVG